MKLLAAEAASDRRWRLLVYRGAMRSCGVALMLCALVGGLYGSRVYFIFALCAAGALMLLSAWRWWGRLRDGRPIRRNEGNTPFIWRRDKRLKPHKPAFIRDGMDFDDDLTPLTTAREEGFSDAQALLARAASALLAAALLFALSLILQA